MCKRPKKRWGQIYCNENVHVCTPAFQGILLIIPGSFIRLSNAVHLPRLPLLLSTTPRTRLFILVMASPWLRRLHTCDPSGHRIIPAENVHPLSRHTPSCWNSQMTSIRDELQSANELATATMASAAEHTAKAQKRITQLECENSLFRERMESRLNGLRMSVEQEKQEGDARVRDVRILQLSCMLE